MERQFRYMAARFDSVAELFVYGLGAYSAAGLLFAAVFVFKGVQRIDSEAQGSGIGFRLLIIPGVAARYSFRDGSDAARNHLWRRIHIGWQRTDHDSALEIGASTDVVGASVCFANGGNRWAHGKATATTLKFEENQFRSAAGDSAIGRPLDKTQNPFCFSARSERSDFGSSCFGVAW
jgi:hypothetical protein